MSSRLLFCCSALVMTLTAQGGIYTEGPFSGAIIPTAGWFGTGSVTDIPSYMKISTVAVTFTTTGGLDGVNGDLYAYLSFDGALIPLLNRVGKGTGSEPTYSFGYQDSGFNAVTLTDSATVNIHNYGGGFVPTGSYLPDSGGVTFATTYGGLDPNGTWTIYFQSMVSGDETTTLTSWSLSITTVPEPINVALGIFGGVFGAVALARSRQVRNLLRRAMVH